MTSIKTRTAGFTLIEVMIVVIIVGVLAAIAIPQYQAYVMRSNRTEGQALLTEAAARQERYFTQNSTYADTVAKLGYASANSQNNLYTLSIPVFTAVTFELRADPINQQANDVDCGRLELTHTGEKRASGPDGADECWR